jgi:histidyl-tRNA synthetase
VYAVAVGDEAQRTALAAVEKLRTQLPALDIVLHAGGGSFKSQMKKADKSGARVALIWGEDEVAAQTVSVKALRDTGGEGERVSQQTVPVEKLQETLCAVLAG